MPRRNSTRWEGLLHISQLSRDTIDDPHEVIGEGEIHLLRVISLDPDRQRIGLSLKSVTANEQIEWMSQKELEADDEEVEVEVEAAEIESDALEASQDQIPRLQLHLPVPDY